MGRTCRAFYRPRMNLRSIMVFFILLVFVLLVYKLHQKYFSVEISRIKPDIPFSALERDDRQYTFAIVFDAGSTGTRIHVYRFRNERYIPDPQTMVKSHQIDPENGPSGPRGPLVHGFEAEPVIISPPSDKNGLQLVDELFREVKPGLSAYASEPVEAADSIEPLLTLAKSFIPSYSWYSVPVALYATAGLRLLPEPVAESILEETRMMLTSYPFKLCLDCVRILDGLDEGVYGWYTINYLLGLADNFVADDDIEDGDADYEQTFQQSIRNKKDTVKKKKQHEAENNFKSNRKHSVGVIDLGGASLQITFLAHYTENVPPDFLYETDKFGGQPITVYTHSYLGLGLNAARMQLLHPVESDEVDLSGRISSSDSTTVENIHRSHARRVKLKPKKAVESATYIDNSASADTNDRQEAGTARSDNTIKNERSKRDANSNPKQKSEANETAAQIILSANETYTSPCLFDGYIGTFRFQNVDVQLKGIVRSTSDSADRYVACYLSARELVTSPQFAMHRPQEVRMLPFYIQSYFFDRAVDSGLINQHEGGTLKVTDYEQAAKNSCNLPKQVDKQPFLCMDLCIIVALLRDGFEFDPTSNLMVMKKIHNVELSWTLGAAFPLIAHLAE